MSDDPRLDPYEQEAARADFYERECANLRARVAELEEALGIILKERAEVVARVAELEAMNDNLIRMAECASEGTLEDYARAERAEARVAELDANVDLWKGRAEFEGIECAKAECRAERAEADLAEARRQYAHMLGVLLDAENALGVEETGELILGPIERLKSDLSEARNFIADLCNRNAGRPETPLLRDARAFLERTGPSASQPLADAEHDDAEEK